jgi:hypothetical protein
MGYCNSGNSHLGQCSSHEAKINTQHFADLVNHHYQVATEEGGNLLWWAFIKGSFLWSQQSRFSLPPYHLKTEIDPISKTLWLVKPQPRDNVPNISYI